MYPLTRNIREARSADEALEILSAALEAAQDTARREGYAGTALEERAGEAAELLEAAEAAAHTHGAYGRAWKIAEAAIELARAAE